jgi:hypothetical protein
MACKLPQRARLYASASSWLRRIGGWLLLLLLHLNLLHLLLLHLHLLSCKPHLPLQVHGRRRRGDDVQLAPHVVQVVLQAAAGSEAF